MPNFEKPTEPAEELPKIALAWGKRGSHAAEAEATGKLPIDKEDLRRGKVLNEDDKTHVRTVVIADTGQVIKVTKAQWDSVMQPEA